VGRWGISRTRLRARIVGCLHRGGRQSRRSSDLGSELWLPSARNVWKGGLQAYGRVWRMARRPYQCDSL